MQISHPPRQRNSKPRLSARSFPGYIRQVFANATYLYVHKGDPLFSVYSPDLLETQKEFLLSQQSQYQLRGSSVDGVKEGAVSMRRVRGSRKPASQLQI
jgi:hypothetical protein